MSVTVGFSPVAPGNSMITTGVAAGAGQPAEGDSPLGFLGALLAMLAPEASLAATDAEAEGTESESGEQAPAPITLPPPATPLVDPKTVDDAVRAQDRTTTARIKGDDTGELADKLSAFADIVDFLEEVASEGGNRPISPKFAKRMAETVEKMAAMLGVVTPPAVPQGMADAAGAGEEADPATAPATGTTTTDPGQATARLVTEFTEAVKQATAFAPVADEPETAPTTDGVEPGVEPEETAATKPPAQPGETTGDAPEIDPATPLGKLIARLTAVAEKLETRAPELSAALATAAKQLAAGTPTPAVPPAATDVPADAPETVTPPATANAGNTDTPSAETIDPEVTTPEAELAELRWTARPRTTSRPASLFNAPNLPVPEAVNAPPKQATTEPSKPASEPVAPADATDTETETLEARERLVPGESKVAERPEAEPKVRERGSFAAQLSEARNDKPATEAQQPGHAQVTPAAVRTDTGVVAPKAVHAAYQAPVQQINMPQVAFEVVRQFSQGSSRFQIRLDPPELGRIDVRMQVDGDGKVHARMTVERAETLDLMQRDQRSLEKALAQAGLDTSKTSLEFSLRQNPFARDGQGQHQQQDGHNPFLRSRTSGADETPATATTTQYRGLASPSGVNLFV